MEEWKTTENLTQHIKSCRFGVLLGIKTLLKEPLDIVIYTDSHSEEMAAIEAVRDKGGAYDEDTAGLS